MGLPLIRASGPFSPGLLEAIPADTLQGIRYPVPISVIFLTSRRVSAVTDAWVGHLETDSVGKRAPHGQAVLEAPICRASGPPPLPHRHRRRTHGRDG
jgi:hypothetical protein